MAKRRSAKQQIRSKRITGTVPQTAFRTQACCIYTGMRIQSTNQDFLLKAQNAVYMTDRREAAEKAKAAPGIFESVNTIAAP
jgi:hypothetical protein